MPVSAAWETRCLRTGATPAGLAPVRRLATSQAHLDSTRTATSQRRAAHSRRRTLHANPPCGDATAPARARARPLPPHRGLRSAFSLWRWIRPGLLQFVVQSAFFFQHQSPYKFVYEYKILSSRTTSNALDTVSDVPGMAASAVRAGCSPGGVDVCTRTPGNAQARPCGCPLHARSCATRGRRVEACGPPLAVHSAACDCSGSHRDASHWGGAGPRRSICPAILSALPPARLPPLRAHVDLGAFVSFAPPRSHSDTTATHDDGET